MSSTKHAINMLPNMWRVLLRRGMTVTCSLFAFATLACGEEQVETDDPVDTICALPYRQSASSCAALGPIAGALPSAVWSGRVSTTNSDGTRSCSEITIFVEQDELRIDRVSESLHSVAYERWVFLDDTSAEIHDIAGHATGRCTCLTASCVCEYTGAVTGTRAWLFDRDLVFLTEHFYLESAFSESHGDAVAQAMCE